jgi:hypothetical protein
LRFGKIARVDVEIRRFARSPEQVLQRRVDLFDLRTGLVDDLKRIACSVNDAIGSVPHLAPQNKPPIHPGRDFFSFGFSGFTGCGPGVHFGQTLGSGTNWSG